MPPIIAKIYDENDKVIERIEGRFKDNQILYKEGFIPILFWKFGGVDKTLKCDFKDIEKDRKPWVARYAQTEKGLEQLTWKKAKKDPDEPPTNNFYKDFEIAWLHKERMRTVPGTNLTEVFKIALLILLIAIGGLNYYTAVQYRSAIGPTVNSSKLAVAAIPAILNGSQECVTTSNAFLHYVQSH